MCFDYHRRYGFDVKAARIFNTYGPRMHPDDGRAVSNFVVQALMGEPITFYGDGSQTRSFCYVDDLIEGFVRFMATPEGISGPINLRNLGEFTIRELAYEAIEITCAESTIIEKPLPSDDPQQRQPDISKARETLDWEPDIPLKEGLVKTVAYLDEFIRGYEDQTNVSKLRRQLHQAGRG